MRRRFILIAALCTVAALAPDCGDDDDSGHPPCMRSLESWCKGGVCDDWRKFDDVIKDPPNILVVSECGTRRQLDVSDGFVYAVYIYDAKSGRLIGARGGGDLIDEDCPDGFFGGDYAVEDCNACLLAGYTPGSKTAACTGPIAEPRMKMCMDHPPAIARDCAECACTHCYPQLYTCAKLEPDASSGPSLCDALATDCLHEHCNSCMVEDDADAGR